MKKPSQVIDEAVQCLLNMEKRHGKFAAIGIVSFGPCGLNSKTNTYGYITTTPKPGWQMTDVVGPFQKAFRGIPIGFDTDVNMVAVSEFAYGGHGTNITSASYITVGTGIGVGMCTNGKPVHGLIHPEGGHIRVPKYVSKKSPEQIKNELKQELSMVPEDSKEAKDIKLRMEQVGKYLDKDGKDTYFGNCKFHCITPEGKAKPYPCVEGLANSQAIAERLGIEKKDLPYVSDDNEVWDLEAYYLAQLCISITFLMSPEVIVLGGGVMKRTILYPKIRKMFKELLGDYFTDSKFNKDIDKYIVRSTFDVKREQMGNKEIKNAAGKKAKLHAGAMGGLELARRVWDLSDKKMIMERDDEIKFLNKQIQQLEGVSSARRPLAKVFKGQYDVSNSGSSGFSFSTVAAGMLLLGIGGGIGAAVTSHLLSSFKKN
mmetsp:Transcript_746/g.1022  ORF Transcript_746/g.1022 Transcript_746/m.1022 type:complete len:429 (-) Transcript_746:124-1410(-)